jgi:hypothetical protein
MSKLEARAQRINDWLEHLHRWEATGGSSASYAKEHGLALWALYHWRGVLIQEGRWQPTRPLRQAKRATPGLEAAPLQFARVAVTGAPDRAVYRSIVVGQRPPLICAIVIMRPRGSNVAKAPTEKSVGVPAASSLRPR